MIEKFKEYLRYERNYSTRTVSSYSDVLYHFSDWLATQGLQFRPELITSDILRRWVLYLMNERQIMPSTLHTYFYVLSTFYRYLYQKQLIPETFVNPTRGVILPKVPKRLPKFFIEKEMDECLALWQKSSNFGVVRAGMIVETIYQTGLRCFEVTGLKQVDVDLQACQLKVLGKRNKQRIVPFGTDLAEKMTQYLALRDATVEKKSDYFFVNNHGGQLSESQVYHMVHNMMEQVSTKVKLSPHVIRHTFATVMLNRGADLNVIKELLGHESIDTTEVYTHVTTGELLEAYKKSHPRG